MFVTEEQEWETDYPYPTQHRFPSRRQNQDGRKEDFQLNKTPGNQDEGQYPLAPQIGIMMFRLKFCSLTCWPSDLGKKRAVNFQFPWTMKSENVGFLWGLNEILPAISSIACYTVGNHYMISTIIITACDVTFYSPKKSVKSPSSFLQNSSYCKSSIQWCGLWRNSPGLMVAFPLMDYEISSTVFTFRDFVSSSGFFSVLFTVFSCCWVFCCCCCSPEPGTL